MSVYDLSLAAAAHTKQRPRFGRGRAYTPAGTRNWEELLAWRFIERHGRPKLTSALRVELFFGGVQANLAKTSATCSSAMRLIPAAIRRRIPRAPSAPG